MAYFTKSFVFSIKEEEVRISIRGSDDRVTEYYFSIARVKDSIANLSQNWGSESPLQFKTKDNTIWIRVFVSDFQREIYSVPLSEYQVFVLEFNAALSERL